MDRDNNWDRIQSAFHLITQSQAEFSAGSATEALQQAYQRGETDEFVKATRLGESWEMRPNDVVVIMNFRADRGRQIARAHRPRVDPPQSSSLDLGRVCCDPDPIR